MYDFHDQGDNVKKRVLLIDGNWNHQIVSLWPHNDLLITIHLASPMELALN
jgi:hypothetical protein